MQDDAKKEYEAKAADLKSQLKQWEADVAKRNGGKKPSRDDIKQNPEIQAKYKKYQQIRDMLDGKPVREKKRKPEAPPPEKTPTKRPRPQATPTATRHSHIDDFETPEIRRLFSPAMPTSIGPTPQRDGRVLGLFDLLDDTDENNTPSKDRQTDASGGGGAVGAPIQATPSKRKRGGDMEPPAAVDSTPVATGRRAMFKTPLKDRDGNVQGGIKTPSSVTKLLFATPSFLRRAPLPAVAELNNQYVSPRRPRLPRKPMVRGLSSVVADLRKMEEEHLDDDIEALREMEAEDGGRPGPAKAAAQPKEAKPKETQPREEDILAPDSQAGSRLLGGFDDEDALDSEPETQLDRNGQPLKVYKKKGQKRTTRRVNMRPTRAKRPAPEEAAAAAEADDDEDIVAETQQGDATTKTRDPASGSDYDSADSEDDDDAGPRKKTKKAGTGDTAAATDKKAGAIKKAAKKVNELAHANFKRLKLKNHGAKGGPGLGSRFRRRR